MRDRSVDHRGRGDVRLAARDPAHTGRPSCGDGHRLYQDRLLVHRFDLVREPRRCVRANVQRQLRWHRTRQSARFSLSPCGSRKAAKAASPARSACATAPSAPMHDRAIHLNPRRLPDSVRCMRWRSNRRRRDGCERQAGAPESGYAGRAGLAAICAMGFTCALRSRHRHQGRSSSP
jgi:hypothetical protein